MHLRSLSSSPTRPAATAPPPPDSPTDGLHARPDPSVRPSKHPTSTESPRTPPSTPISTYTPTQEPSSMWALTASKLERAAQAQLTGSRGSSGLRELVLLSNVWGAARPLWDQQERERVEVERRRKEDEERWLDGVLEEMLEEEEGDEDFVSLRLVERERDEVGDSGFLEEDGGAEWRGKRESLGAIDEADEGSESLGFGVDSTGTDHPLPPSPPLPPRSPPIDLPSPNRSSHQRHLPFSLDVSSSPPLHLPALTPDSTPPNPSFATLMSTSADSADSDDLEESYQWVQDRATAQRLGLLALDLSPPSQKKRAGDPPPHHHSIDTLAYPHGVHHPSSFFSSAEVDSAIPFPFGPDRPPPSPISLALTLSTASQTQAQSQWTPRPPRSLSLPSLRAKAASFVDGAERELGRLPRFEGGIGKSFYDCVDFGRPPSPSSSSSSSPDRAADEDSPSQLALVLARPRPILPPYVDFDFTEPRGRR